MNAAINYVEQEKLDELEQQYRSRGYDVRRDYRSPSGRQYDMVALKGDERAVFEVKALPALAGQGRVLRELRRQAYDDGFTTFRLVVVSPPHRTDVSVPGLERQLAEHMRRHLPQELQGLAKRVGIDAVSDLDISAIQASTGGLDLAGDGVVAVTLGDGGSEGDEESQDDFPFRFRVRVTSDLRLAEVYELQPDVSGFVE
jgi:hypothetical protein